MSDKRGPCALRPQIAPRGGVAPHDFLGTPTPPVYGDLAENNERGRMALNMNSDRGRMSLSRNTDGGRNAPRQIL